VAEDIPSNVVKSDLVVPCFFKQDSDPPQCGVHKGPLIKKNTDHKFGSAEVRPFDYWICARSGNVIRENPDRLEIG
jgi:hypothetical protein